MLNADPSIVQIECNIPLSLDEIPNDDLNLPSETYTTDFVIHFADDQTDFANTSFDITRNHLYRFNVTIDPKGNLAVEVNDWENVFNNDFYF